MTPKEKPEAVAEALRKCVSDVEKASETIFSLSRGVHRRPSPASAAAVGDYFRATKSQPPQAGPGGQLPRLLQLLPGGRGPLHLPAGERAQRGGLPHEPAREGAWAVARCVPRGVLVHHSFSGTEMDGDKTSYQSKETCTSRDWSGPWLTLCVFVRLCFPCAQGRVPVLVCTDAAARGLDVPGVTHVVQARERDKSPSLASLQRRLSAPLLVTASDERSAELSACPNPCPYPCPQADFALSAVDYLHRAGRTARAGAKGNLISFYGALDGMKRCAWWWCGVPYWFCELQIGFVWPRVNGVAPRVKDPPPVRRCRGGLGAARRSRAEGGGGRRACGAP